MNNHICTEDYQECDKCPRTNCFVGEIVKEHIKLVKRRK